MNSSLTICPYIQFIIYYGSITLLSLEHDSGNNYKYFKEGVVWKGKKSCLYVCITAEEVR